MTCGGGALAVYAIAKPPVEAFIVSKDDETTTKGEEAKRGEDGEGDDAAQEDDAKEGEEKTPGRKARKRVAEGEAGRGGKVRRRLCRRGGEGAEAHGADVAPRRRRRASFGPFRRERATTGFDPRPRRPGGG